jgi:hypothetical protein
MANRTLAEIDEICRRCPDVKRLHDQLSDMPELDLRWDETEKSVFKVYLKPGFLSGVNEDRWFLEIHEGLQGSFVSWAGQEKFLEDLRRSFSDVVKDSTRKNGSNVRDDIKVDWIVRCTSWYLSIITEKH